MLLHGGPLPMAAALLQSDAEGLALGDFWSLTQQAGPLRWPIFVVLAVGLVQIFVKLYELLRDHGASAKLRSTDVAAMSLERIADLVGRQEESMLSSLQSTMLNVFQTRPGEGLLHDEISNFVALQQDQFAIFRRRMEFLSDTAGALGLMGTVWGMFTVFFQGTSEQDVILRGMGIALITTLLGLVVSIILNFFSTELSTLFDRRLEQVSKKSDELRFRLMELAPQPELTPVSAGRIAAQSESSGRAPAGAPGERRRGGEPDRKVEAATRVGGDSRVSDAAASPPSTAVPHPSTAPGSSTATSPTPPGAPVSVPPASAGPDSAAAAPTPSGPPASTPQWRHVELAARNGAARAGETGHELTLAVLDADGEPAADVPVRVAIAAGGGTFDGGARTAGGRSDESGLVGFRCALPEKAGLLRLDVALPGQPGPPTRLEVPVEPSAPARVEQEGNHQAAVAGMRLPQPLSVRVSDRFGNPVSGVPVGFAVREGGGRLGGGEAEVSVVTDDRGRASTPFVVASDAGQNVVSASVEGIGGSIQFVAFGTSS